MRRSDRGFALIEVLAAVALLATAGLAMAELTSGLTSDLTEARRRETEMAAASRLLSAYSVLTRPDLDRRMGIADAGGGFLVEIQRPEPELYRLSIRRRDAAAQEVLVTVLYRHRRTDAR